MEEPPNLKTQSKRKRCAAWTAKQVKERIPIVDWLPKYKWKTCIIPDLMAGLTVAFINVPQGLAFSILADVDVVYGLYTAVFSAFFYSILGTAPVSSFGPVAVGSMLTGDAVSSALHTNFTRNEIAATVTFQIGLWYFIGFIFRLGVISMVFRKPFVCGFIASCAMHILAKTIKMILGIKIANSYGFFCFFLNINGIFQNLHLFNYPTLIISVIIIFMLVLNLVVFRPLLAKYTKFILPMEGIVMFVSVIISYFIYFESMGVPIVGDVPTGFPKPTPPEMSLISYTYHSSLIVAIINYATTIAMTAFFNDKVDHNQELFAMSIINLVCCNLQCITIGNSMMRTVIAVNLGVKSLMATMISTILLLFVILFGGPLFYHLPECVLGCIIVTAASQLLIQRLMEVKSIWSSSFENIFIWSLTLTAGLILDLSMGMIIGSTLTIRQILSEVKSKQKLEKHMENEQIENGKLTIVEPEKNSLLKEHRGKRAKIV